MRISKKQNRKTGDGRAPKRYNSEQAPHRASRYFLCRVSFVKKGIKLFSRVFLLLEKTILKKARIRATAADPPCQSRTRRAGLVTGQAPHRASRYFFGLDSFARHTAELCTNAWISFEKTILKKARIRATAADPPCQSRTRRAGLVTGQAPHRASRYFFGLASFARHTAELCTNAWISFEKTILKKARIRATAADPPCQSRTRRAGLVTGQAPHRASRYFLRWVSFVKKEVKLFFASLPLLEKTILKKARIRATAADLVTGQAMLILIMVLGATMLGVTTIAGYVSLQKIRTATDIVDSTKSIYAADAGVEWWLYKSFSSQQNASDAQQPTFSNDTVLEVQEFPELVKSIGHAGRSYRAFGVFLTEFLED